ncbi:MAG: hypothetical protein Q9222_005473 [Ikaeria aurantiellina]
MLLSIAAPEFVLGKALAERWAAQESKRQAALEGWTTMHAFFANMRGFVLRFQVNAVKTSLIPSEPDELGRSLHKLRPGPFAEGEAPYYEQDPKRAAIIESIHCGHPHCNAAKQTSDMKDYGDEGTYGSAATQQGMTEHHKESNHLPSKWDTRQPLGAKSPKPTPTHFAPQSLSRRHTAEPLNLATPTTLVNTPRSLAYSPTLSGISASSPSPTSHFQPQSAPPNSPKEEINKAEPNLQEEKPPPTHEHPTWEATWPLNTLQIQYAQDIGLIPRSPYIPHPALKDRSKGDSFIKGFAILQITALVIQIIARSFQNLATTLLEVNVLAFAACAIVTYILLWHKPQDVKVPVYIDTADKDAILSRDQIIKLAARAPVATLVINDFWLHGVSVRAQSDNIFPWTPGIRVHLPSFLAKEPFLVSPVIIGIGGGGAIFGAVHFVAWNFAFPTPLERLLWRISCTVLVFFPLLGTVFYFVMQQGAKKVGAMDAQLNRSIRPASWLIGLAYFAARGYLIVEVFRELAEPEASVFRQVNWPSAIPYFA